mgnify:CR=1 FL=1
MRHLTDQLRLFLAEKLIYWALSVAPEKHPDSLAILEAAHHVSKSRLSNKRRRPK